MTGTVSYRRIVRRETHSSRSAATVVVLGAVALAALWLGAEIVLHLLGRDPLLASPAALVTAVLGAASPSASGTAPAAGAGLLLLGIALLLGAVLPGRRGRRARIDERLALIVDDRVVAAGLAMRLSTAVGVPREQVRVRIGRREAEAAITPVSGIPVDRATAEAVLRGELAECGLVPPLRGRLRIDAHGAVGA